MASSPDVVNFKDLLSNLLSIDNNVRSSAEVCYSEIPEQEKLFQLLEVLGEKNLVEETELAVVLLRKLVTALYHEMFSKLPPIVQEQAKTEMLRLLASDMNQFFKRKLCEVVSELARNCIDEDGNNNWPDFLKFLFDCASSSDPCGREIALIMFASVPGVFGNQQSRYVDIIHEMLSRSLTDEFDKVRYIAVKATCNFLLANEKEFHVLKQFGTCFNLIIQFCRQELNSEDSNPEEILRQLIELVETCPLVVREHLDEFFQLCFTSLTNSQQPESCKHLCLEAIVTLCEAAPAMVKKLAPSQISDSLSLLLSLMTNIEDNDRWNYADDDDSDIDSESTPVIAESALDRLACALGGKAVLPLVMNTLPQLMQSANWKERYAGLMAISTIGEGCYKDMTLVIVQVVDGVLPFLLDQHMRVRYAACNALGQMAADFASLFQKKFHEKVLPALCSVLSDRSSRRVQAHAGAALVNFFEDCPKNILSPYLSSLANTLENVLQEALADFAESGSKLVLEQAVVTLASLADSAQERFSVHYERFMPPLKHIIVNANQPRLGLLRGKTIECVSLIGLAVGKEKFLSDASEVMDLLLKAHTANGPMADDDPQLSYLIAAWARICKILGPGFKTYLPYVMAPVLRAASIKPEVAVLDSEDVKLVGNDDDWEFVNLGEKHNFGIRTSGLEEKATACQMLVCYVRELKEGFADYIEDTAKLMVPMLKFYFHDGVRVAASEILPYLLESAKVRGSAYVQELWRFMLPPFLSTLDSEPEAEVLCEHMAAFAQCIEILNCPCLQPEDFNTLITLLNKHLANHFQQYQHRQDRRRGEDYDDVLEESLVKQDDENTYLLSKISEIMSTLFSTYKKDLFVYFDVLLPHFVNLLEPFRPWSDRQWSLCVFADVIEYCGPACSRYQEYFLSALMTSLRSKSVDLKQTAAYTVGVLSQFGGPQFAQFCSDCLPLLLNMINDPDSRSEVNERATENAISAITKFFIFNNSHISMEQLLPAWLTWLPVWEDEEEVQCIYSFLCTMLETNNPFLLGKDNCNIPRIVEVIAEAFRKEALEATSDLGKRILSLVKYIKDSTELFSICMSQLTHNQREALRLAIIAYSKE